MQNEEARPLWSDIGEFDIPAEWLRMHMTTTENLFRKLYQSEFPRYSVADHALANVVGIPLTDAQQKIIAYHDELERQPIVVHSRESISQTTTGRRASTLLIDDPFPDDIFPVTGSLLDVDFADLELRVLAFMDHSDIFTVAKDSTTYHNNHPETNQVERPKNRAARRKEAALLRRRNK